MDHTKLTFIDFYSVIEPFTVSDPSLLTICVERTSDFPRERPLQYLQCSVHERSKSAELALVVHASARPHIVEI